MMIIQGPQPTCPECGTVLEPSEYCILSPISYRCPNCNFEINLFKKEEENEID